MKKQLILLHGAIGTKGQLKRIAALLEADFEVFLFDFEGHGDNFSDAVFSIDLFTENLTGFINGNKLEKVSFFGYSMGGYVALNYARLNPDKVEAIYTFATKFAWSPETAQVEVKKLNPEKIEEKIPQFATYLAKIHQANNWKMVLNKTATMMLELGDRPTLSEVTLAEVKCPVTVAVGSLDNMVSEEETRKAADSIPNGTFSLLHEMVHPIEQNDLGRIVDEIKQAFGDL